MYRIPSESDCPHPERELTYLGQMGITAFYQCNRCNSVTITR